MYSWADRRRNEQATGPDAKLGHGLSRRYLGLVLAAVLVVLSIFLTITIWHQYRREIETQRQEATTTAEFLGAVAPEAVFFRDYLTLETLVRQSDEKADVVFAVVIDNDGLPMTRSLDRTDPVIINAEATAASPDVIDVTRAAASQSQVRDVRIPIVSEGVLLGEVYLGYSIAPVQNNAKRFAGQATIAMVALALILTALTAMVFEWQIRRPLRELVTGANALAAGELTRRLPARADDELGTVTNAFNAMATELELTVEEALEATKAAESATQAKSAFLANMSHEIRTPLNAVLGLTELLIATELSSEQQQMLKTVNDSGTSLLSIINDILYLSKVEAGHIELDEKPFSVRGLVEHVGSMFQLDADQRGLRFEVDVHPDVANSYLGDEARLRQLLVNLVGNAMKFTEAGGVTLRVTTAATPNGSDGLEFSVRDTGIGIAKNAIDSLFEPFSQADASTTRRFGGTGLGLSICRRLVEVMDGEIDVRSMEGKGSRFFFVVPLEAVETELTTPEHEPRNAPEEPSGHDQASLVRILLVEDNPINETVALHMLDRLGYTADVARDGVEAVSMAAHFLYDIVLMDIQMPRLDGVSAMHQIHEILPDGHRPRIVALTANAVEGDREHYLELGMDGYLAKPLRLAELGEQLRSTLSVVPRTPASA